MLGSYEHNLGGGDAARAAWALNSTLCARLITSTLVWRLRATTRLLPIEVAVRQLPIVIAAYAALMPMIVMDTVGTGVEVPSWKRHAASVMAKFARTIIGRSAIGARLNVKPTPRMDEDGLDVRLTLREKGTCINVRTTRNDRSIGRIVRRRSVKSKGIIGNTSDLVALIHH